MYVFLLSSRRGQKKKKKANKRSKLVRLAGGIVTIIAEKQIESQGLWIAALILLNVGVVPLIVADLGLTRLMYVYLPARAARKQRRER